MGTIVDLRENGGAIIRDARRGGGGGGTTSRTVISSLLPGAATWTTHDATRRRYVHGAAGLSMLSGDVPRVERAWPGVDMLRMEPAYTNRVPLTSNTTPWAAQPDPGVSCALGSVVGGVQMLRISCASQFGKVRMGGLGAWGNAAWAENSHRLLSSAYMRQPDTGAANGGFLTIEDGSSVFQIVANVYFRQKRLVVKSVGSTIPYRATDAWLEEVLPGLFRINIVANYVVANATGSNIFVWGGTFATELEAGGTEAFPGTTVGVEIGAVAIAEYDATTAIDPREIVSHYDAAGTGVKATDMATTASPGAGMQWEAITLAAAVAAAARGTLRLSWMPLCHWFQLQVSSVYGLLSGATANDCLWVSTDATGNTSINASDGRGRSCACPVKFFAHDLLDLALDFDRQAGRMRLRVLHHGGPVYTGAWSALDARGLALPATMLLQFAGFAGMLGQLALYDDVLTEAEFRSLSASGAQAGQRVVFDVSGISGREFWKVSNSNLHVLTDGRRPNFPMVMGSAASIAMEHGAIADMSIGGGVQYLHCRWPGRPTDTTSALRCVAADHQPSLTFAETTLDGFEKSFQVNGDSINAMVHGNVTAAGLHASFYYAGATHGFGSQYKRGVTGVYTTVANQQFGAACGPGFHLVTVEGWPEETAAGAPVAMWARVAVQHDMTGSVEDFLFMTVPTDPPMATDGKTIYQFTGFSGCIEEPGSRRWGHGYSPRKTVGVVGG